jgi:hypothetical protein
MTCSDVGGIMPYYFHDYLKQRIQPWDKRRLIDKGKTREEIKEIHRWSSIYYRFKITQEEWQAMFDKQQGCCAICGVSQENLKHPLEIDRDHVTGRIRGLLCRKCNCGIGMFGEDVENINKAIRYLEKS